METTELASWMPPGAWQFNSHVAAIFDRHVRQSVPFYDEMQCLVATIAAECVPDGGKVIDLGTATGTVISTLHQKIFARSPTYLGVDSSSDMLNVANQRLSHIPNVQLIHGDICELELPKCSLCVCFLVLSFIEPANRLSLLRRIRSSVARNGWFIVVDKVACQNAILENAFTECHENFKIGSGLSQDEVRMKKNSIRGVLVPNTLDENFELLRLAGFAEIEVFFKWLNFAGLVVR